MNKLTSEYYGSYDVFLGGDDEPVIGHNQSYVGPKKRKSKRPEKDQNNKKEDNPNARWNLIGVY